MLIKVIALCFGVLLFGAGAYYLKTENDPESKKIYTATLVIGLVVTAVSLFLLIK